MLPNMLGADFGDQITRFATLIDPRNNHFEVLVERITCFFQKEGRHSVISIGFSWVHG